MEELSEKLQGIVEHALWEVVTEFFIMPNDLMAQLEVPNLIKPDYSPLEILNNDFKNFTKDWFELGLDLKVVSLNWSSAEFISHHTTLNSMKEVQVQMNGAVGDIRAKAFQLGSYRDPETTMLETAYLPCNRHGLVPAIAEDETSKIKLHNCYLIIGKC